MTLRAFADNYIYLLLNAAAPEAAVVDPDNRRLAQRLKTLEVAGPVPKPTVPLMLEEECATNPFFRWDDSRLASALATLPGIATFRRLCEIT